MLMNNYKCYITTLHLHSTLQGYTVCINILHYGNILYLKSIYIF